MSTPASKMIDRTPRRDDGTGVCPRPVPVCGPVLGPPVGSLLVARRPEGDTNSLTGVSAAKAMPLRPDARLRAGARSCVALSRRRHAGVAIASVVASSASIARQSEGRPALATGTEIASMQSVHVGEEVFEMRAVILYMLGVPVFLIVVLWLFGVV